MAKRSTWSLVGVACTEAHSYICQDIMDVPNPIAIYPLNGKFGTREVSLHPLSPATPSNTLLAPGSHGDQDGSFYFKGLSNSFVEIKYTAKELDTKDSITLLAWVYPEGVAGPIVNYRSNGFGVHMWQVSPGKLFARFVRRNDMPTDPLVSSKVLPSRVWSYVGAAYDRSTGIARLWLNNETIVTLNIGKYELRTQARYIRIGALDNDARYFKGRIACVQFYHGALTDGQMDAVRDRCSRLVPTGCRDGFFPLRGLCLKVEANKTLSFNDAARDCRSQNASLASLPMVYHRSALSRYVSQTHINNNKLMYIGMVITGDPVWLNGKPLGSNMWASPVDGIISTAPTCAVVTEEKRLHFTPCQSMGYICQMRQLSLVQGRPATASSTVAGSDPRDAIDGLLTTCFASRQETNPHWKVTFDIVKYLHKVEVKKNKDCCKTHVSLLTVTVSNEAGEITGQCGGSLHYGIQRDYTFDCMPPLRANSLTITAVGVNTSLVMCEVSTTTFETPNDLRGVTREVWHSQAYKTEQSRNMKENAIFSSAPSGVHMLYEFDAPRDIANSYLQRLTAYLQVPYSGNYTFYVSCDDLCELWISNVPEQGIGHNSTASVSGTLDSAPIAKAGGSTGYQSWGKYPSQTSVPVYLHCCFLYKLQGYMAERYGKDHFSVGMKLPDNVTYERPIKSNRLFSLLPGKRELTVHIGHNNKITAFVGSQVHINGFYKFCCNGVYCPPCTLRVSLLINSKQLVISNHAEMSCNTTLFTVILDGAMQPGIHPVQVTYSFVNESSSEKKENIETVELKAIVLSECQFDRGICGMEYASGKGREDIWKINLKKNDPYIFIDGKYQASVITKELPFIGFHKRVGVCLKFRYRMSGTSSESIVSIYKQTPQTTQLIWRINGYHTNEWKSGRVAWVGTPNTKIVFNGTSNINGSHSIAITNVSITTETCTAQPYFSLPGYSCRSNEFQCDNGQCVKRNLKCDGDFACYDQSDEKDCLCPSKKFLCPSGDCILSSEVCDGKKNCKDGADEKNCGRPCSNKFQCVDGSCLAWSSTCRHSRQCTAATNNPTICSLSGKCPLNNLGCHVMVNTTEQQTTDKNCKSIISHCHFENGFCGLDPGKDSEFQWTTTTGATLTEETGPLFDHSTLTSKGSYIYIEASNRKPGDEARLVSGWLDANKTLCLQFWYHMYGKDVGQLNVILKTNTSERIVWQQRGNQGNKWRFAQTPLKSGELYKFVLEGVTTGGMEGDMAVDDLSMIGTSCPKQITTQGTPDCYFEGSKCGWHGNKWSLYEVGRIRVSAFSTHTKGPPRNLTSPPFNHDSHQWKCVRFFYLLAGSPGYKLWVPKLNVYLETANSSFNKIFSSGDVPSQWMFVQRPIAEQFINVKLVFSVPRMMMRRDVSIDGVTFSRNPCHAIPPQPQVSTQTVPKMTPPVTYWLEGQGNLTVLYENYVTVKGCSQYCRPGIYCPTCARQLYINAGGKSTCIMSSVTLDCKTHCVTANVTVSSASRSYDIRMFEVLDYNCKENNITNRGSIEGRVLRLDHSEVCPISKEWCRWHNEQNSTLALQWVANGAPHDFQLPVYAHSNTEVPPLSIPAIYSKSFSLCLWFKTRFSGFYVNYTIDNGLGKVLVTMINVTSSNVILTIFGKEESAERELSNGMWHFLCVTWLNQNGCLYIDGERSLTVIDNQARLPDDQGEVKIRHTYVSSSSSNWLDLGLLSNLNIWDSALDENNIRVMSLGCGLERGDITSWEEVGSSVPAEYKAPSTCKDNKIASRLILSAKLNTTASNITNSTTISTLLSPTYPRSAEYHLQCLRFRYMLLGPGAQRLVVYQEMTSLGVRQPVWETPPPEVIGRMHEWHYGQVPVTAVESFRLMFSGKLGEKPGYIAIAGISLGEGYCKHIPSNSGQACDQRLTNPSGYVISPNYPGYYFNGMSCVWHITAPAKHEIRLEFQDFLLEAHVTCSNDFLEIRDGPEVTSPLLGKYCEHIYPQLLQSTGNQLTVVFQSNAKEYRRGFKLYYHFIQHGSNDRCEEHQDCPSDCTCTDVRGKGKYWGEDSRILVEASELLAIPSKLPLHTSALLFQRNRISQIMENDIRNLPYLLHIDLSHNILLHVDDQAFDNLTSIDTIRMNSNFLRKLPPRVFNKLQSLHVLDLSVNLLKSLPFDIFAGLCNLTVLSLRSNQLAGLPYGVFNSTTNLTHLFLQDNIISDIPDGLFETLFRLKVLNLRNNKILRLTQDTFKGLSSLQYLYLGKNKLSDVSPMAFSGLPVLEYLELDRFVLCCYAEKSSAVEGRLVCKSPRDAFSSCDDLMKNRSLQVAVWMLGLMALVGNVFVIFWRVSDNQCNQTHSFLLTNLAVSDLLMGVYLMIIAIQDTKWQGEYFKHDLAWRSGFLCQFAGIISMFSSEVSVFILALITADRLVCISFPFKFQRLTKKRARIWCGIIWFLGLVVAVLPASGIGYFYDKEGDFGFYGRSGVCLALQLSEDRPAGWEYSVAFFIGLNGLAFLFILLAYVAMFCTVKRVSGAVRSTSMNKESAMAKKLVFIIMTDFFCWMPVIVIGILSLTGVFYDPTKEVYAWIAVFVLPVNSSINPILYTFSTASVRKIISVKRRGFNNLISGTLSLDGLKGRKNGDKCLSAGDGVTQVSCVSPVPMVEIRPRKHEDEKTRKIRLVETPGILQDDATSSGVGYATVMVESRDTLGLHLMKYFTKSEHAQYEQEIKFAKTVQLYRGHPNLVDYRWHSKVKNQIIDYGKVRTPKFKGNTSLICYEFVSSTTLEDFLAHAGAMNFDTLCVLAIDIISAIEFLETHGLSHNNIISTNVLIGRASKIPPVRAVLGGFSRATTKHAQTEAHTNPACSDNSDNGNDVKQFGQLLAVLLGHCHGSSEYSEIHDIMNLCFEENYQNALRAALIRNKLETAFCADGVWDTFL